MKSIISLVATIALAITFTLTACEEKKKQDGTDAKATEADSEAEAAVATQEAAAPTTFTDTRDKKTYKIVRIAEQVWMAENLNYEAEYSMCGGTVSKTEEWMDEDTGEVSGSWTYYTLEYNNNANCDKYGRLYDWETAKKVCPKGWHLPSNTEWKTLVEGDKEVGNKLKATSGWDNNGNGTDNYGFSALPGGSAEYEFFGDSYYEVFNGVGSYGCWWGDSGDKPKRARIWNATSDNFSYDEDNNIYNTGNSGKCSVRCIKN
jgi:uncharacterized protein (TIGR02145 family)